MQKSEFRQSLLVKHHEDTKFEAMEANNGAPRPQFLYRRLGVEEATGGTSRRAPPDGPDRARKAAI